MAKVKGSTHVIAGTTAADDDGTSSRRFQNSDSTDKYKFRTEGNIGLAGLNRQIVNDLDEGGRSGYLGEEEDSVIAYNASKAFSLKGDNASIGYWAYWALNDGSAATATACATPASDGCVHDWSGPGTSSTMLTLEMLDAADQTSTDATLNRSFRNTIVESFELNLRKGEQARVNVSVRGGGAFGSHDGTPSSDASIVDYRSKVFTFHKNVVLHSSSTTGWDGAVTDYGTNTAFYIAPGSLVTTTHGLLDGTPTNSYQQYLEGLSMRVVNTIDVPRSHSADLVDYIRDSADYVIVNREVFLDLTFVADDGASGPYDLLDEHEAGTARAWEFFLGDSTVIDANGANDDLLTYFAAAFAYCIPVPQAEADSSTSPNETRQITLTYRAGAASDDAGVGWKCGFSVDNSSQLGA